MTKLNLTKEERLEHRKRINKRTAHESRERSKQYKEYLEIIIEIIKSEILAAETLERLLIIEQCDLKILFLDVCGLLVAENKKPLKIECVYTWPRIFALPEPYDYSKTLAESFYNP